MGDVIEFQHRLAVAMGEEGSEAFEAFLVEEGLELLVAFRSISDDAVRQSIIRVVVAMAEAGFKPS